MLGRGESRYVFEVAADAPKELVRQAVQDFFKVKVLSVRTLKMPGKRKRYGRYVGKSPSWKKAIVTLKEGDKITMLEAE
jgi:large subunit ribosomal protein L23